MPRPPCFRFLSIGVCRNALAVVFALCAPLVHAQSAAPVGAIVGKVFNPATKEFVRNAQIKVLETGLLAISGDEGGYALSVPPGRNTVVVTFTGYRAVQVTVEVPRGASVTRDIELISSLDESDAQPGDAITLNAFVVSSGREGYAKAIMEQRGSMNITNSVSSDLFGDNSEGNLGEFLKHMPGVDIDVLFGEVRNVRIRGLSADYTSVTVDGFSMASADANAGGGRAFSFEQVSLSTMDSVEVSKTISADVDANAPAGTINLKTKRAFDRDGRRIAWQANVTAFSDAFTMKQTLGPDERGGHKIRPGGLLEYSDVFFNKRLGVVLNVSENNQFQVTSRTTLTYNRTPTAADPRPEVLTAMTFLHAPRFNKRFSTALTTDLKVPGHLTLSLSAIYNFADLWNPQRNENFTMGARNTITGTDPITSFTTTTAGTLVAGPVSIAKPGETWTVLPKFEIRCIHGGGPVWIFRFLERLYSPELPRLDLERQQPDADRTRVSRHALLAGKQRLEDRSDRRTRYGRWRELYQRLG